MTATDRGRGAVSAGIAALAVVGAVLTQVGSGTILPPLGWYLVTSVCVAATLVVLRVGEGAVRVLVAVTVVIVVLGGVARTADGVHPVQQRHDGGVVMTELAAEMLLGGENVYAAELSDELGATYRVLDPTVADSPVNPLVAHYPYLPASFLVHVPFVAALGDLYDARLLYALVAAAALGVVARADGTPPWRRAAAIAAIGLNGAVALYLPWGSNDTAAASLLVLAGLLGGRWPIAAGIALAVGVSMKLPLVVVAGPLLVMWWLTQRDVARRVGGAAVVTLLATTLPFVAAGAADLVEDTVLFNLGAVDLSYPVSGIGLGAMAPDVVDGPVVLVVSLLLVSVAGAVAAVALRRHPAPEVALAAGGLLALAAMWPARTFQLTYVPLVVVLWAPLWRVVEIEDRPRVDITTAARSGGDRTPVR